MALDRPWFQLTRLAALAGALVAVVCLSASAGAQPQARTATLTGIVKDSAGAPIADVEVVVRERRLGTRTDAQGRFTLTAPPGSHLVWIRRLGFASGTFEWTARERERVEVDITLQRLPSHLDPVVVRAQEDRRPAGRSSIVGAIFDDHGQPVAEVEVQLVGGTRATATAQDGTFAFRGLAPGSYAIRARQIGFEPALFHLRLVEDDQREVTLRLHALAQTLDPVQIIERSGFGRSEAVIQELDRRLQWLGNHAFVLGPDELVSKKKMPLDLLVAYSGGAALAQSGAMRTGRIRSLGLGTQPASSAGSPEGACILLNGDTPRFEPLRLYSADQIETLEVYGASSELTGTVGDRFSSVPACRREGLTHPTYYVIWLRGSHTVKP